MPGRNQIDDLDTLLTLLRMHGVSDFSGDVFGSTYQIRLADTVPAVLETKPKAGQDEPEADPNPLTGLSSSEEDELFGA